MTLTGRTRRLVSVFLAVIALASLTLVSAAAFGGLNDPPKTREFKAHLNGYQETPSISSTGWGEFRARLVDDNTIHYVFTYGGLEGGNSLFAHVHFGGRAMAGGVSYYLCGGSTKPDPCPNVEGTVEGDITPADVIGPNGQGIEPGSFGEIVRAMRAGMAYANIHTTRWPGGEIRGQINDPDQKQYER